MHASVPDSSAPTDDSSTAEPLPDVPFGSATGTMRAVVRHRYGDPSTWRLAEVPVPIPAPAEVLVEVRAAGIDRGVWHLGTGRPLVARLVGFGVLRPKQPVLGMDVAGLVAAVGPGVDGFRPGDAVFGIATGSFAEFAVAKAEKLAPLDARVDFRHAAATPVSGLAAMQAVRDVAKVRAGQRVLVLGASGGVGSFAVQFAHVAGASVTGVASAQKAQLVLGLGADHTIDYRSEDPLDGSRRYDVIIDVGGRNSLRRLRRTLERDGTLVIVGGEDGNVLTGGAGRQLRAALLSLAVPQRLTAFIAKERGDDIAELGRMLAAGDLVAAVERTYPLAEAPVGVDDLVRGRIPGKAVVQATPDR